LLGEPQFCEERLSLFSLVSLKDYLVVFCCSTACAEGLKLLCEAPEVLVFVVDSFHYRGWFSKFACFTAYFDALLVFADFGAHAYVFGKPACRTDFCHVAQLAKEWRRYLRFSTREPDVVCKVRLKSNSIDVVAFQIFPTLILSSQLCLSPSRKTLSWKAS
jgi:hypothetical protein